MSKYLSYPWNGCRELRWELDDSSLHPIRFRVPLGGDSVDELEVVRYRSSGIRARHEAEGWTFHRPRSLTVPDRCDAADGARVDHPTVQPII